MRLGNENRLDVAIHALASDEPEAAQLTAAAGRLADRLGVGLAKESVVDAIGSCTDVERLLPAYRAGSLTENRTLVIEAHLGDCSDCRHRLRTGIGTTVVDWSTPTSRAKSTPRSAPAISWRPQSLVWRVAASIALLVSSFYVYKTYWQIPIGVRAQVESTNGSTYRITSAGGRLASPGDKLSEGDLLRTSGDAHAVVRLADGSRVEVNQRSEFGVSARGRNMTIALENGSVIVEAAKRTTGHLYVKTPDCRVAVTGTVFSVNSGIKGSRVAVIEGTVHVLHAGIDTVVHSGDQVATSDNLIPVSVNQQIAWSHDRDRYLVLLAQFAVLRQSLEHIPLPGPRYTSDLLLRVPADTLLYVSIPNLGEFLSEANGIFQDQLEKSPALQQWWNQGREQNAAQLDALVGKLHGISQYFGDEIVLVAVNSQTAPEVAVIADVRQAGLASFLKSQFPSSDSPDGLTLVDQSELTSSSSAAGRQRGIFAVVREHEAIFASSMATLKQINAQLNAGASGFAAGDFGQQIAAAYDRGAGVIVAADLHRMVINNIQRHGDADAGGEVAENSGMSDVRYLIAEHREVHGQPENHLNLQFAGARRGVASWLATPGTMGSLDFVTPNAAFAVAYLSKEPKSIVDDILNIASAKDEKATQNLNKVEEKFQISLRDDLAANLGGEALLSLDGAILPTPSWKVIVEVHDAVRLEKTLERLTNAIRNQPEAKGQAPSIEWKDIGAQRFYLVRDLTSGRELIDYTFEAGYMIMAPNRAILMEALHAHAVGDSLARSAGFKALLPTDAYDNYSAIAYQNLGPVLAPLLSQVKGDAAAAVQQLAADARPTAVCAWGQDNRIEAATNSRMFGFDFLTLGALLHEGNQHGHQSVRESHGSH